MKKLSVLSLKFSLFLAFWVSSCNYPVTNLDEPTPFFETPQNIDGDLPMGMTIDSMNEEELEILANFRNTYYENEAKEALKNARLSGNDTEREAALWHLSKTYKSSNHTIIDLFLK